MNEGWIVLKRFRYAQRWQSLSIIRGKVDKYFLGILACLCWHWCNKCHTIPVNIPQYHFQRENISLDESLSRWSSWEFQVGRFTEFISEWTLLYKQTEERNQTLTKFLHSTFNLKPRSLQMISVLFCILSHNRLFLPLSKFPTCCVI